MINEIYKYHSDWLNVAYSYLNNKQDAEDVIQDVYIKIISKINNGKIKNIKYKDTVNKYFVYKVIRNSCIDFIRKKRSYIDVEIENIKVIEELEESNIAKSKMFIKIDNEVAKWEKEEKEIFELYMYSGMSMYKISKLFGVSKSTIFNRINMGRDKLRLKFGEDMEDYFNNDFDKI